MYILKSDRNKNFYVCYDHGIIGGELELRTTCQENGTLDLRIAYVGAIDVYTLPGNYRVQDVQDHDVIHQMLVNVLERT